MGPHAPKKTGPLTSNNTRHASGSVSFCGRAQQHPECDKTTADSVKVADGLRDSAPARGGGPNQTWMAAMDSSHGVWVDVGGAWHSRGLKLYPLSTSTASGSGCCLETAAIPAQPHNTHQPPPHCPSPPQEDGPPSPPGGQSPSDSPPLPPPYTYICRHRNCRITKEFSIRYAQRAANVRRPTP